MERLSGTIWPIIFTQRHWKEMKSGEAKWHNMANHFYTEALEGDESGEAKWHVQSARCENLINLYDSLCPKMVIYVCAEWSSTYIYGTVQNLDSGLDWIGRKNGLENGCDKFEGVGVACNRSLVSTVTHSRAENKLCR